MLAQKTSSNVVAGVREDGGILRDSQTVTIMVCRLKLSSAAGPCLMESLARGLRLEQRQPRVRVSASAPGIRSV